MSADAIENSHPNVRALAQALTFILGGWTLQPIPPRPPGDEHENDYSRKQREEYNRLRADLTRADGAGIHISYDTWDKRLKLSGSFPEGYAPGGRYVDGKYQTPDYVIHCSPTKGVQAIAKDVLNRLLPNYELLFADVCTRKAEDDRRKAVARRFVPKLAKALGEPNPVTSEGSRWRQSHSARNDEWRIGYWTVNSYHVGTDGGRVDIKDLSVDYETALKIAALVTKAKPKPTT
jgi:hypothetical protein